MHYSLKQTVTLSFQAIALVLAMGDWAKTVIKQRYNLRIGYRLLVINVLAYLRAANSAKITHLGKYQSSVSP